MRVFGGMTGSCCPRWWVLWSPTSCPRDSFQCPPDSVYSEHRGGCWRYGRAIADRTCHRLTRLGRYRQWRREARPGRRAAQGFPFPQSESVLLRWSAVRRKDEVNPSLPVFSSITWVKLSIPCPSPLSSVPSCLFTCASSASTRCSDE